MFLFVVVCISLAKSVALLGGMALLGEGMALLEEVCHCEHGFSDPHPSSLEANLLAALR